ncbi:MAG: DNA polymerase clamp loader subunit A [Candidatus Thiodiazotropha taylori]|uniref:DNA polymerase clamp loader subunit A n=1 Tax=Candidatus Thiodiazotropha taylori TaxID=2792791 RepID=A0A9E4KAC2_9GAMM|nr:DNA polymerase clamp loader subunit A [Candidatus Thiodiazotropha taylori]MCW4255095.1 DNA polymerase clamp loader subunit A [Candidatus Thiodiazotropha taylori]
MAKLDIFGNLIIEEEEVDVKPKSKSPFDYIKDIGDKNYPENLDDYNAFLTNLAFSQRKDLVHYANEMNKYHQLGDKEQFDFYYYAIPRKNLFAKWNKALKSKYTEMIMEYFNISYKVAKQYEIILEKKHLAQIEDWWNNKEGGK